MNKFLQQYIDLMLNLQSILERLHIQIGTYDGSNTLCVISHWVRPRKGVSSAENGMVGGRTIRWWEGGCRRVNGIRGLPESPHPSLLLRISHPPLHNLGHPMDYCHGYQSDGQVSWRWWWWINDTGEDVSLWRVRSAVRQQWVCIDFVRDKTASRRSGALSQWLQL